MFDFAGSYLWQQEVLQDLKDKNLFRSLKTLTSPQGRIIVIDGREVLNFCSNDYLGLANDPRLVEAVIQALHRYGMGSGAARLISGNNDLTNQLEEELAQWKRVESVLVFNSGYHANMGVIPALAGEGDVIFSDELNHASLIDGCRLSKAETVVYRHHDMNHLEELLKRRGGVSPPTFDAISGRGNPAPTRKFFIVTEAVFSMEGDLCPLEDLLSLAQRYDALIYLDEAHAVGVLGEKGEGLAPQNPPPNLITMGTLGKAFGSYGAFVAGSKALKDFLINKARSFIFTTALPPAMIGASLEALKIIQAEPNRREALWENISFFSGILKTQQPQSPIFSWSVGSADETMKLSSRLMEAGFYIQGIRPPTVPEGTSRLRVTVTALHTKEDLKKLGESLRAFRPFQAHT